jgi:hypothetical protein
MLVICRRRPREIVMVKKVASRGSDQFMVRFPEGMREEIRAAAEAKGRSMNSEIIDRLQETFLQDSFLPEGLDYSDMIHELEDEIEKHQALQEKYDREYGVDYFEAFKDEILEAIRETKKG